MGDRIRKVDGAYTEGEARALIAPLLGMTTQELRGLIIVGIDSEGFGGITQTPNMSDAMVLAALEAITAHMRAQGVTTP